MQFNKTNTLPHKRKENKKTNKFLPKKFYLQQANATL